MDEHPPRENAQSQTALGEDFRLVQAVYPVLVVFKAVHEQLHRAALHVVVVKGFVLQSRREVVQKPFGALRGCAVSRDIIKVIRGAQLLKFRRREVIFEVCVIFFGRFGVIVQDTKVQVSDLLFVLIHMLFLPVKSLLENIIQQARGGCNAGFVNKHRN